ncbi:hypothetical protein EV361DRAFT_872871 [Lentinula raphanica]|nr:hypothetical protein EV361DRAFT_872871 [Lentinula raphanica]
MFLVLSPSHRSPSRSRCFDFKACGRAILVLLGLVSLACASPVRYTGRGAVVKSTGYRRGDNSRSGSSHWHSSALKFLDSYRPTYDESSDCGSGCSNSKMAYRPTLRYEHISLPQRGRDSSTAEKEKPADTSLSKTGTSQSYRPKYYSDRYSSGRVDSSLRYSDPRGPGHDLWRPDSRGNRISSSQSGADSSTAEREKRPTASLDNTGSSQSEPIGTFLLNFASPESTESVDVEPDVVYDFLKLAKIKVSDPVQGHAKKDKMGYIHFALDLLDEGPLGQNGKGGGLVGKVLDQKPVSGIIHKEGNEGAIYFEVENGKLSLICVAGEMAQFSRSLWKMLRNNLQAEDLQFFSVMYIRSPTRIGNVRFCVNLSAVWSIASVENTTNDE